MAKLTSVADQMSEIIIDVDRIVVTGDGAVPERSQIGSAIQAELQHALQIADWVDGLAARNVTRAVVSAASSSTSSGKSDLARNVAHGIVRSLRGHNR